eukprot:15474611-Alexandrium_andersonii.AAC.1
MEFREQLLVTLPDGGAQVGLGEGCGVRDLRAAATGGEFPDQRGASAHHLDGAGVVNASLLS